MYKNKIKSLLYVATFTLGAAQAADTQVSLWDSIKAKTTLGLQKFNDLPTAARYGICGLSAAAVVYGLDYLKDRWDPNAALHRAARKNNFLSAWRIKRVAQQAGYLLCSAVLVDACDANKEDIIGALLEAYPNLQQTSAYQKWQKNKRPGITQEKFSNPYTDDSLSFLPEPSTSNVVQGSFSNPENIDEFIAQFKSATQEQQNQMAQIAARSNNALQMKKALWLSDSNVSPALRVRVDAPDDAGSKGKGPSFVEKTLFECYVQCEEDSDALEAVCKHINFSKDKVLIEEFIKRKQFDLLNKLKVAGCFDPSACPALERLILTLQEVPAYVHLTLQGFLSDEECAQVAKHIQDQLNDNEVPAADVNKWTSRIKHEYEKQRSHNYIYKTVVIDLTDDVEVQKGDACGLHAVRNAGIVFTILQKPHVTQEDIRGELRSAPNTIGTAIADLKKIMTSPEHAAKFVGHCNRDYENLDEVAIKALLECQVPSASFTVIESVSQFSPDRPWERDAWKAITNFVCAQNATHIFIIKDDKGTVRHGDEVLSAQPHWTFMVAHKVNGGKPMLYVGDSANPNKGNVDIDLATLLDVLSSGEFDLGSFAPGANVSASSTVPARANTKEVERAHSDVSSVVRMAYLLSCSQNERETGRAVYEQFDRAQNLYNGQRYLEMLVKIEEIINAAKRNNCLTSLYFYLEYVCDNSSGHGLGLYTMLQNSYRSMKDSDKRIADELLIELEHAKVNLKDVGAGSISVGPSVPESSSGPVPSCSSN